MKKLLLAALAATTLSSVAYADTMVVDRGLPTANLNNAAGSNRSNVAWADADGGFYGDSFTLAGTSSTIYTISSLRTWVASDNVPTSATLFTGIGLNADLTAALSTAVFTLTSYADSSEYQRLGGAYRSLYQVDFSGLNIVAVGGTTISFGVDGLNGGDFFFNHASNAALSGSPQDSADNVMAYYLHDGAGAKFDSPFNSLGSGWDKSSDINVQVFASTAAAPEPAAWAMMIVGFGAVGATMRRRKVAVSFA